MLDGALRGNAASPTLRKTCECANLPNRLAASVPPQASLLKPAPITAWPPFATGLWRGSKGRGDEGADRA